MQTRFARGAAPYRTGYALKPPGRPIDILFKNEVLRNFLLAPKISNAGLDSAVYHQSQTFPLTGDHKVNTDWFLRQTMTDAFYSDTIINIAMETMPRVAEEMAGQKSPLVDFVVTFITDLLGIVSFSNMRVIHNSLAALIANKTALRQQILNKLKVPAKTAQFLKNSNFICEGVFGPLPQSFLDKCYGWQGEYLVATDKKKYINNNYTNYGASTSGRGRGQKRQANASNARGKRGKYTPNNNNYPAA